MRNYGNEVSIWRSSYIERRLHIDGRKKESVACYSKHRVLIIKSWKSTIFILSLLPWLLANSGLLGDEKVL